MRVRTTAMPDMLELRRSDDGAPERLEIPLYILKHANSRHDIEMIANEYAVGAFDGRGQFTRDDGRTGHARMLLRQRAPAVVRDDQGLFRKEINSVLTYTPFPGVAADEFAADELSFTPDLFTAVAYARAVGLGSRQDIEEAIINGRLGLYSEPTLNGEPFGPPRAQHRVILLQDLHRALG